MVKKLLIGLAAFFGLVVVLLAAAMAVPFFISGDVYRAQVTSLIENATGREFRIDGTIDVPSPARSGAFGRGRVLRQRQGRRRPRAWRRLKSLDIKIRLRPLLSGKLEITGFVLDRPEIALEVDKKGRPNWRLGEAPRPLPGPDPSPHSDAQDRRFDRAAQPVPSDRLRDPPRQRELLRRAQRRAVARGDIDVKFAMAGLDSPLTADGNATWSGETVYFDYAIARPGAFAGGEPSGIELQYHVAIRCHFDFSGSGVGEPEPKLSGSVVLTVPSLRGFAKWTGIPIRRARHRPRPVFDQGHARRRRRQLRFRPGRGGSGRDQGHGRDRLRQCGRAALRARQPGVEGPRPQSLSRAKQRGGTRYFDGERGSSNRQRIGATRRSTCRS